MSSSAPTVKTCESQRLQSGAAIGGPLNGARALSRVSRPGGIKKKVEFPKSYERCLECVCLFGVCLMSVGRLGLVGGALCEFGDL
jgi:hypothetical protein